MSTYYVPNISSGARNTAENKTKLMPSDSMTRSRVNNLISDSNKCYKDHRAGKRPTGDVEVGQAIVLKSVAKEALFSKSHI